MLAVVVLVGWLGPWPAVAAEELEADDPERVEQKQDAGGTVEYLQVEASALPTSNTIVTKLPVPLQITPANIGTVGPALFREQRDEVLSDALRNISGVNVQTQSGVHDFFVVRGFDSLSGSLVLTDGAPEPEATYYPLYNVAGIEVMKGPSGFLYGKDPLAATVNIARKQPMPSDLFGFSLAAGSWNTYEGKLDWNTAIESGSLDFRVNAFWRQSDNYRDLDRSEHWAVNPSLTWRIGERSRLNVNLEHADADYSPDAGLPLYNGRVAPVSRRQSYHSPFDFSDQNVSRFQLDYEIELGDRLTLRNKTYYRELDWRSNGTLLLGAFGVDVGGGLIVPLVARGLTLLDNRQTFVGNQFEAILTLGAGRVRHHLLTGLEIARQEDDTDLSFAEPCGPVGPPGCLPPIALFDPVETASSITTTPVLAGESRAEILAPYIVDQIRFSDRYHLLIGARWDELSFDDGISGVSRDDGELSPMAGFVFAPSEQLSFYVNGGRSHAPPGARVVDADRQPEQSTQYELGAKRKFLDGKLQTTFALYDIERQNIAIPDDTGVLQQSGDQRSRGVELEMAAESRSGFRAVLSYAYNDAELTRFTERVVVGPNPITDFIVVDHGGNTPAFAPRHLANVWATQRFRGGLGFGGGLRYVDEQFIAEDNAFAIDRAWIVDATVFYDVGPWRARLNLHNLTDEEYAIRGFGSSSVIPADPFAAFLGIEYRR